jgi:hypothetical protein
MLLREWIRKSNWNQVYDKLTYAPFTRIASLSPSIALIPPPYSSTLYKNKTPYGYNTVHYSIYGRIRPYVNLTVATSLSLPYEGKERPAGVFLFFLGGGGGGGGGGVPNEGYYFF